ncbi:MAG: trypsin-like serine protease [Dehalococcoidia bacterium]|nr:trypsin-like serine protease [Dehalococcoidia bacterium]
MELEAYLKTHLKLYTFLAVLTGLMMVGLPLTLAVTQRAGRAPELRPDPPAAIRAQPAGVSSGLLLTVAGPPPEANALALVIPAVVRVTGAAFAGSGVIIDPSGTVLTSAHIVGNATEVGVVVEDTWRLTGRVVRTDAKRDLALVQLPPGAYRAASLARGAAPSLGAAAVVIGYPLGLPGPASVAIGVVSRLVHEPELRRTVLQTDAAVNLGNSGGPIVDYRGEIIGVVASVMGEYQSVPARGISFAVSAETIRQEFLTG